MKRVPARIHVLLASRAPVGLVIRRGPSKQVATILWDRRNDTFQLGQWLKGRIYERRSDLSPDGKYLIYFAMNGRWGSPGGGSWTAISRAPYLKALAIYMKDDCWHGGGLWTDNASYWLNDVYGYQMQRESRKVRRDRDFVPSACFGGECPGVYYPRLMRDGWCFEERIEEASFNSRDIFEKRVGYGWLLRKIAHAQTGSPEGKGCYWDEHQLVRRESYTELDFPDWEWADLDGERLVWARAGKLFCGRIAPDGLFGETELFDFNPMGFEPIETPY